MDKYSEARNYLAEYLYNAWRWEIKDWSYKTSFSTNTIRFTLRWLEVPSKAGYKSIYIPCIRNGINLRMNDG